MLPRSVRKWFGPTKPVSPIRRSNLPVKRLGANGIGLEDRVVPVVGAFDIPAAVAAGGLYDGVVLFDDGCTASLLSTGRHIVTAAHCVDGDDADDDPDPGTYTVRFDLPDGEITMDVVHTAAAPTIFVPDGWTGRTRDGFDIAIVTLPAVAPSGPGMDGGTGRLGADRYRLFDRATDGPDINETFTMVGYGRTGTGTLGRNSAGDVTRLEVQRITVSGDPASFRLRLGGGATDPATAAIAYDRNAPDRVADDIAAALEALADVDDVTVRAVGSGPHAGSFEVRFDDPATAGGRTGRDFPTLTAFAVTGGTAATVAITPLIDGGVGSIKRLGRNTWTDTGAILNNELKRVRVEATDPAATFRLTFGGVETDPIPFNASAATVRTRLETDIPALAGNVRVSRGPAEPGRPNRRTYYVQFVNALAGTDQGNLTIRGTNTIATSVGTLEDGGSNPGYTDQTLIYDFDNGTAINDFFGTYYADPGTGLGVSEANQSNGDSGGPAFISVGGVPVISGIVSLSRQSIGSPSDLDDDGNNTFGEYAVMTRASSFLAFARDNTDGPYDLVFDMQFQALGRFDGGADSILVRRLGGNLEILVGAAGAEEMYYSDAMANVRSVRIVGFDDDETLVVDGDLGVAVTADLGAGVDTITVDFGPGFVGESLDLDGGGNEPNTLNLLNTPAVAVVTQLVVQDGRAEYEMEYRDAAGTALLRLDIEDFVTVNDNTAVTGRYDLVGSDDADTFTVGNGAAVGGLAALGIADATGATTFNVTNKARVDISGFNGADTFAVDGTVVPFGLTGGIVLWGGTSTVLAPAQPDDGAADTFYVRATAVAVATFGQAGDDNFHVSSDAGIGDLGNLDAVLADVTVDGGLGTANRLVVSDFGGAANAGVRVFADRVEGLAGPTGGSTVFYRATGGAFRPADGRGVRVVGSNGGGDGFTVFGTSDESSTTVEGNGGDDRFDLAADGFGVGSDTVVLGGAGDDAITLRAGTGVAGLAVGVSGGDGTDRFAVVGRAGTDTVTVRYAAGAFAGRVLGLGQAVGFDTAEAVDYAGNGGDDALALVDGTGTAYGSAADPIRGIVYRPRAAGGDVRINAGGTLAVTPDLGFTGVAAFSVDGGANGDFLTVLGVSSAGLASGTAFGEATAADGSDTIAVGTDRVDVANRTLGPLTGVAYAGVNGLYVRTGAEGPTAGDTVTAAVSALPLFLDGMGPSVGTVGDRLTAVNADGSRLRPQDRALLRTTGVNGGAAVRIQRRGDGAGVNFVGFETVVGTDALAVGAGPGGGPHVRLLEPASDGAAPAPRLSLANLPVVDIMAFDPAFRGGVRVATGDINGDGIEDVAVAAGAGGGPHVRAFDGIDGRLLFDVMAYGLYSGGAYVAVADVNGDGFGDIISGAGEGGGPHVRAFSGRDGAVLYDFFAYGLDFRGGVRVAAGDLTGDGPAEIITGAGRGGGPHIRAFDMTRGGAVAAEFFPYDPAFRGGVVVAAGDVTGDGRADVLAAAPEGGLPVVLAFTGHTLTPVRGSLAFDPRFTGGLSVASVDADGDGADDIVVGAGRGGLPAVRAFRFADGAAVAEVFAFDPTFLGGVEVG